MENEMLDQMHKKLVWKITIQFIWILCITAMIVCIIYEGIMQVHRNQDVYKRQGLYRNEDSSINS